MSLELTPSVGALQWLVTAVGIRPIIESFWERSSAPSRYAAPRRPQYEDSPSPAISRASVTSTAGAFSWCRARSEHDRRA
jgi:hypothetical protein